MVVHIHLLKKGIEVVHVHPIPQRTLGPRPRFGLGCEATDGDRDSEWSGLISEGHGSTDIRETNGCGSVEGVAHVAHVA